MAKRRSKKRTAKRGPGRPKGSRNKTAALSAVPTLDLVAEIGRRESRLSELRDYRDQLASELMQTEEELAGLEAVIAAAGGASRTPARRGPGRPAGKRGPGRPKGKRGPGRPKGSTNKTAAGRPRKRPQNDMTLEDAIAQSLRGQVMGIPEITDAVLASGYQSGAANFKTIVNQTLIKSDRFKKVARGQYTVA